LSKVVAFNAEWLYNVLEHKTESEDCHMTRQDLINAIMELLERADYRKLRLVWVCAKRLID
jgi:hypothetical protein